MCHLKEIKYNNNLTSSHFTLMCNIIFFVPLAPPSDTGGSEITAHILEADDGKGTELLHLLEFILTDNADY